MSDDVTREAQELGQLERVGDRLRLRFVRQLPHSRETVWKALVEPQRLFAWFPTTIDGERTPGAALRFTFPNGEAPGFDGEMLAFEPPSLMELTWGAEILRFELQPSDRNSCVLTFTNTFDELGKAARDGAGWHTCLDLLAYESNERPAPWKSAERWRQVRGAYVESFGPKASTIGPPVEWESVHGAAE